MKLVLNYKQICTLVCVPLFKNAQAKLGAICVNNIALNTVNTRNAVSKTINPMRKLTVIYMKQFLKNLNKYIY